MKFEKGRGNDKPFTLALVGNPNSGKTAVFNALTGSKQRIGNWPGVTVERKDGIFELDDGSVVNVVDLPGIYSLSAFSEDERVAVEYIMSGDADLFVNIVDGANLERNLYLTTLLAELRKPMAVVVTMMDIVEDRGITIDLDHLSKHLGIPVIGVNATSTGSGTMHKLMEAVRSGGEGIRRTPAGKKLNKIRAFSRFFGIRGRKATSNKISNVSGLFPFFSDILKISHPVKPSFKVEYPAVVENEIEKFIPECSAAAKVLRIPDRVLALRLIEGDAFALKSVGAHGGNVDEKELQASRDRISGLLKEFPDEVLVNSRYGVVNGLCCDVVDNKSQSGGFFTQKLDKIILNRWLGIPFFLFVMYVVFWVTQVVGSAFIDFFDILGGTIFVDGFSVLLRRFSAPGFLVALLANGLGAGIQTVGTFLPPIFFMFLCLSILEDSGYMARAAFVMDKFMSWLGLPGKSFVPLLVGFGCSVPAIMATRTLDSKRDRFLTIFMTPFMSCSAKLPVWVVFAAAFFPENPGKLVFFMYISGLILGIITGLLLKHTLFVGEPSHFIMELPPYHAPRPKHILLCAWDRMRVFIFRAGKVVLPMVLILGVLNTVGSDGSIGNDNTENSLLSSMGRTITPVFRPMGVENGNWPATVAVFTGLFAKEAVIGTLNGLYGQNAAFAEAGDESSEDGEAEEEFDFWGGVRDAFTSVKDGVHGIFAAFTDPLGFGSVSDDEETIAEDNEADLSVFANMRASFTKGRLQVFSYLLFVLLYVPCMAAMGAAFRELGGFYACLFMGYLTLLGWSVATLFYQITLGHEALWITIPILILVGMFSGFRKMGENRKVEFT